MSAKVSFVVAIYGVEAYIEECVQSLCRQTLEEIEIVLVDDCTPDRSIDLAMRVIENYPQRKEQVKLVRHEKNRGICQTRWDGIEASTGEYIILMDGDDYVDELMAERLYAKAVENGADMVVSDFWIDYPQGGRVKEMAPHGVGKDGENIRRDIINLNVPVNIWCKLVKRSVYANKDIVWPVKGYADDVVESIATAQLASKIDYVNEPLYFYRFNPKSYSRGWDEQKRQKMFEEYLENWEVLYAFMRRQNMLEKYEEGVFKGKMRIKKMLLPMLANRKYRRLYLSTFPEVDRAFMWGNKYRKPTYRERIWIMAVWLGLYPTFKKRLNSKRFRPRLNWIP